MELTRRKCLAGAGGLLALVCDFSAARSVPEQRTGVVVMGGPAFGSYWRVTVPKGSDETAVRTQIKAVIKAVDDSMSPFRAATEISRFNATRTTRPFAASSQLRVVVSESLRIARLSDGAFDPTVGPLVNRYGFGPIKGEPGANFTDIAVGAGTISKSRPDATLDLCGIAKGYALDLIAKALEAIGVRDFVVELGGEVIAYGRHPRGRPWRIAVEAPQQDDRTVQRVVELGGHALATSGDKINGYTVAGRRYNHIIDMKRSAPADAGIASVSVIARSAMEADALATTIIALGSRKGWEFASRHNISALILVRDRDGIHEHAVSNFRNFDSVKEKA